LPGSLIPRSAASATSPSGNSMVAINTCWTVSQPGLTATSRVASASTVAA
jgi:hypothetical protein